MAISETKGKTMWRLISMC